jgi:hypothetical protein|tara:strand:+ start:336 stop:575 length:240 start_codon:yes stop_codon:yes gene_type:complete
MAVLKRYFWNWFIWGTQGLNTLLAGSPDESTSSRAYRLKEKIVWKDLYSLINWLFRDKDHCKDAYLVEAAKKESWRKHV